MSALDELRVESALIVGMKSFTSRFRLSIFCSHGGSRSRLIEEWEREAPPKPISKNPCHGRGCASSVLHFGFGSARLRPSNLHGDRGALSMAPHLRQMGVRGSVRANLRKPVPRTWLCLVRASLRIWERESPSEPSPGDRSRKFTQAQKKDGPAPRASGDGAGGVLGERRTSLRVL